jgi:hypothetical protein
MEITFQQIKTEFDQTFGYVRQDIAKILEMDIKLHYTIALLVCCGCEMLTWHRNLRDDQAWEVFGSLLPDARAFKAISKPLWEALRNGLAHNFRPDTIRVGNGDWRFTILSQPSAPLVAITNGQPNWIHLNIRKVSSRVISQINAYEQELHANPDARRRFYEELQRSIKTIGADAATITDAFRSTLGQTYS